jgi:hypothetical protein
LKPDSHKAIKEICDQAEAAGKWFNKKMSDIWLSPQEFYNAATQPKAYCYLRDWEMADPNDRLKELDKLVTHYQNEHFHFKKKLMDWKKATGISF